MAKKRKKNRQKKDKATAQISHLKKEATKQEEVWEGYKLQGSEEMIVRKKTIIESLRQGNAVNRACEQAGISRRLFYVWLSKDEEFARAVRDAKLSRVHLVEDALYKKALEGDTTAMIFFLKTRAPGEWNIEQKLRLEHSGRLEGEKSDIKILVQNLGYESVIDLIRELIDADRGKRKVQSIRRGIKGDNS